MKYYRLLKGIIRRSYLLNFYSSLENGGIFGWLCKIWCWLNKASMDVEAMEKAKWDFEVGETVQLGNSRCIGAISFRWIRFGQKLYEIQINNRYYFYYEWELKKTDLRVFSKVVIKEIKFKKLEEGLRCQPTKRWTPIRYHHPYWNVSV